MTGVVLDRADSLPVRGMAAGVAGSSARALTDSLGRFTLTGVPRAPIRIVVYGAPFLPDTVLVPADRDTVTIYLRRQLVRLAPVEVRGEPLLPRVRFEQIAQPSTVTLTAEEIRRAPSVLEADVIRAIQLLPGTIAKNDYSIGYNVRGGESDQNLVQLDGVPIFNPSHVGGLFSTFDADAIARTDFLTGGFPAGSSGRLSSVLDIGLRPGNEESLHGSAHVSLLSSKLLLDGPLPGPGTFLASVRRTYVDAVVSAFTREVLPYYFTDAVAKVHLPTGPGGFVSLTGYWGRDALDLPLVDSGETRDPVNLGLGWGNRLLGLSWRTTAVGVPVEARAAVSAFSTTLGLLPNLARFDNSARLHLANVAIEPLSGGRHTLRGGMGVESYRMAYDISSPTLGTTFLSTRYQTTVWSAFVDHQWSPGPLRLRPGLRMEHVPEAGFTGLSPRAALKLFLNPSLAVTGSAGRYFQAIHSIRDQELPVTLFEFWIGADQYVPVARSDHAVLGVEAWKGAEFQLTVEGYRKTFTNLVTPNRANNLRVRGDEFLPVSGNAWGVDVLLRRHAGRVRGWIAYTFGNAERRVAGVTYPPAHDRRHTLNVVFQAPGPLGSDLAVRWGYGSPLPYTAWVGQWEHRVYNATDHAFDDSFTEPIAGPINGARYPLYSRLDLGFRWQFRKWGARWEPYLQIANAYNRRNAFLYYFDFDDVPPTRTGVSQLPFLPTFGIEVRF
ncbi:MAG: TonB-dependent receptor [Gemmatimonadetes bacterium]|nr:TonB-dependent receptor [Gemmatimonadota bacterium]